ncbi:unnamed protein product [Somion occarium]|uniref:Uncharacterized protein n=1 Tax=Somion occarium TaxID=3059160 RepID=A0ABP1CSQ6_9APHY
MIRFNFQLQSFACPLWIATRTPQHQLFQLLGLNHLTHPTLKVQPWTFPYGEVVRVTTTIANGDEVDCQSDYWMIEHVYIFPLVLAPPVPRLLAIFLRMWIFWITYICLNGSTHDFITAKGITYVLLSLRSPHTPRESACNSETYPTSLG